MGTSSLWFDIAIPQRSADRQQTRRNMTAPVLPVVSGPHPDLNYITPATAAHLFSAVRSGFTFSLLDCRFQYEYDGGHIQACTARCLGKH